MSGEIRLRRPVEADHRFLVNSVDDWWGGRKMHSCCPGCGSSTSRGTSWIAEDDDRIVGFLVGFISPDRPGRGVHPHGRRRARTTAAPGLGRMLYERFFEDVRGRGRPTGRRRDLAGQPDVRRVPPGDGFRAGRGPGTQNLYGTPAYPDYDADGDDRVVFSREI